MYFIGWRSAINRKFHAKVLAYSEYLKKKKKKFNVAAVSAVGIAHIPSDLRKSAFCKLNSKNENSKKKNEGTKTKANKINQSQVNGFAI